MRLLTQRKTVNMISGPLLPAILQFALPLMATNLLQMFYNAADIVIAGMSSEPDAVGAIGSTTPFLSLVVNIFIGFSAGTDVIVARAFGAKNAEETSKGVHTSICLSVILGALGGILGIAICKPVLTAMGCTGRLLELAVIYSQIYFLSLPLLSLTNFLSAVLRAKGDTKTPLYVLAATGLLNVLMNMFFVLVVGLSVEGVALATALANGVSAVILWYCLSKAEDDCRVSWKKLRIDKETCGKICRIGLPAGIQNAFFSLSNMLIQSSILQVNNALTPASSSYEPVVKGNAAAQSIESFVFTAVNGVTQAAGTFTSQNMGVGNYRRIRKILWSIAGITSVLSVVTTAAIIMFRDPMLALYDVRNESDVLSALAYDTAMKRIWYKWPPFLVFALMNTAAGVLRGLGKSVSTAVVSLVGTCAFRVGWIYTAFVIWPTLEVVYISYGISWLLTGGAFFVVVLLLLRKQIRKQDAAMKIEAT